ncbi:PLP-dependent aminotransferase family protein [Stenotrophomonas sp. 24(2023)]|uniref:aminotransferase-like domain-containing protein n=1 Tax=Stenotrophomonas sp. 24(2023) TaxID=3068324 RepID=UPI0027E0F59C|nr:PLP-dependent aminotransferase family protein [Stenotrophomonas sp. 24(2023)]WMJ67706.1 PLP-dependent aminotransferase family protein [Stenotrophomonas sp. 24(2023)]
MDTDHAATATPPRYQRLSDELADAIHGGRLPVGSRLPSLRQMASQRGLSLNTVIAAYRQLEDAGLVIPRAKAGFEVAPRLSAPERSLRDVPSLPNAPGQLALMERVLAAQRQPGVVDLAFAGPRGRQFYPAAQLARHTALVLRHGQQTLERYARPNGSQRLLAQIVRRGPRMGLHTTAERLQLTHGGMEALQLALRAVTSPGDAVGIEAPSYFNLYPLLSHLGLRAIELPTHPQTGLDVDAVETLLDSTPLAALMVMPTVHNPLGCTMPVAAKQRLATLVNARRLPLIEDAVYADLQFSEPPAPLLKAFDRDGWVMVVAGFSKTLAPDYRIGWLDGGRFAERIALLKFQTSGAEPQLLGDAVASYLESGTYEHHLRRLRRLYRDQVGRLRQLVAEHFPASTRATEPQGGFLLWLELPGVDTRELFEQALAENIVFMPGQVYSRGARYRHCLRLSCCQTLDARFIGAVQRVGELARELDAQR